MLKVLSLALLVVVTTFSFAQETQLLQGTTKDAETGLPIPFVSIILKENGRGLMSNDRGSFQLTISEVMLSDSLLFSCIGYELRSLPVSKLAGMNSEIKLKAKTFELDEVVVFPLLPEEYIRKAVEKIKDNYANAPSLSKGYYTELMSENKQFLKYEEAVTNTWVPAIGDTVKTHTSVLHARMAKDLVELQFMKEKREKQEAKQAKKNAKKKAKSGEEDTSSETSKEIVSANFGGPSQVLASDPVRSHDAFMKPENFKKFVYQFEPQVAFGDKKLMVISFDQKKQIDNMRTNGRVYIDMDSDAIVAIEYAGHFNIPTALKPVLFAMGFGITDPTFNSMVHYREVNGRWYVSSVKRDVQAELTKKYMFSKNETSSFDVEQTYSVQELNTTSAAPIAEKLRMTTDKTMTEQAQFKVASFWNTYSTVRPQKLETYLQQ
jgi:hypothetical protein